MQRNGCKPLKQGCNWGVAGVAADERMYPREFALSSQDFLHLPPYATSVWGLKLLVYEALSY